MITLLSDVSSQVQTFWPSMFMDQLKATTLLPGLVNRNYKGEIKKAGNQVTVSQINRPTADMKTVGEGHETFNTNTLDVSEVTVTADKVISCAVKFDDLVSLQSQIGDKDSEIRKALVEAVELKLNQYLYSLVAPSTSSPDHSISGVSDFNAAQLQAVRLLASQAKWRRDGWWLLADPSFYSDLLNAQTLTSSDYVNNDAPVVAGQMSSQRLGFNILEDNSLDGTCRPGFVTGSADMALAFHKDFMYLVMQQEPEFKISDLHSNNQFAYQLSIKMVVGAKLGIEGNKKHIFVYNN